MATKIQIVIAIFIGCLVMVATGAALFPVIKMLLVETITLSPEKNLYFSYFQMNAFSFLWLGISAFAGGYVTCWIATEGKIFSALLAGLLIFVVLVIASTVTGTTSLWSILSALAIVPFTVMGGIVRRIIENKNED